MKSGVPEVTAPIYSHLTYDIVPDERIVVRSPDVLIVEGLNVLQPPGSRFDGTVGVAVNDYFDFTVYVDAESEDVERWYVERFLSLRETAFADPDSYFHRYAVLSDEEARSTAARIWREINGPNLVENILPTRSRATLVLVKGPDHSVEGPATQALRVSTSRSTVSAPRRRRGFRRAADVAEAPLDLGHGVGAVVRAGAGHLRGGQ